MPSTLQSSLSPSTLNPLLDLELDIVECYIINLLVETPTPVRLLRIKFDELNELIKTIPCNRLNLITQWNRTYLKLIRKFNEIFSKDVDEQTEVVQQHHDISCQTILPSSSPKQVTSTIIPLPLSNEQKNQKVQHLTNRFLNIPKKKIKGNSELQKAKQTFLCEMQEEFSRLENVKSKADIDGLVQLAIQVRKVRKLAISFVNDGPLKWTLFAFAMDKLPEELQQKYLRIYAHKNDSLIIFTLFLRSCIRNCRQMLTAMENEKRLNNDCGQSTFCKYCKTSGHRIKDCRSLFCFKCFQNGHTKKKCTDKF